MFMNSGSTHNSLEVATAKFLGCKTISIVPHLVSIMGGGGQLQCTAIGPNLTWSVQDMQFTFVFLLNCIRGLWLGIRGPLIERYRPSYYGFLPSPNVVSIYGHECSPQGMDTTPLDLQLISTESFCKYTQLHPSMVMSVLFSLNAYFTSTFKSPLQPSVSHVLT